MSTKRQSVQYIKTTNMRVMVVLKEKSENHQNHECLPSKCVDVGEDK